MTATRVRVQFSRAIRFTAALAFVAEIILIVAALVPATAHAQSYSVLYSFSGAVDGNWPSVLVRDKAGNLYGTTYSGGDLTCYPPNGCGTVFKLDSSNTVTILYNFTGYQQFIDPTGVIRDAAGNLHGTTQEGGT